MSNMSAKVRFSLSLCDQLQITTAAGDGLSVNHNASVLDCDIVTYRNSFCVESTGGLDNRKVSGTGQSTRVGK